VAETPDSKRSEYLWASWTTDAELRTALNQSCPPACVASLVQLGAQLGLDVTARFRGCRLLTQNANDLLYSLHVQCRKRLWVSSKQLDRPV